MFTFAARPQTLTKPSITHPPHLPLPTAMPIVSNTATCYTLSFGLFRQIEDGPITPITEDEWNLFVIKEVCPLFKNFSVREELGFWKGEPLPIKVVSYITSRFDDGVSVYGLAQTYKQMFGQETVLINSYTTFPEFV